MTGAGPCMIARSVDIGAAGGGAGYRAADHGVAAAAHGGDGRGGGAHQGAGAGAWVRPADALRQQLDSAALCRSVQPGAGAASLIRLGAIERRPGHDTVGLASQFDHAKAGSIRTCQPAGFAALGVAEAPRECAATGDLKHQTACGDGAAAAAACRSRRRCTCRRVMTCTGQRGTAPGCLHGRHCICRDPQRPAPLNPIQLRLRPWLQPDALHGYSVCQLRGLSR